MRKLVYVLAGLVILLLVLDRIALVVATSMLDKRVEKELGAPVDASVHGFPFLPAAITRTLPSVTITSDAVRLGGPDLTVRQLHADMTDVEVRSSRDAIAKTFTATAVVPYSEVERRGELPAGSLSGTADGRIQLAENATVLGRSLPITVIGRPRRDGDVVTIEGSEIQIGNAGVTLSDQAREDLQERLRVRLPVEDLPSGTSLQDLAAKPEGLQLTLTGHDVPVTQL